MGDISAEPSMEEILSSIKRIIAEEGEGQPRARRAQRSSPPPLQIEEDDALADHDVDGGDDRYAERDRDVRGDGGADEDPILELSDPMPEPERAPDRPRARSEAPRSSTAASGATGDSIVSRQTAAASRDSLATLSKLLVKPEPGSDGTLEGMVREMLRPMLREWLDANLPDLVETLVAREIEKITGQSN